MDLPRAVLIRKFKKSGQVVKFFRNKPLMFSFYAEIHYLDRIEISPNLKSVNSCNDWVNSILD